MVRRFGGEEYIARIVALDVLRDWGAWGAAIVTSLHVTALQHAGSRLARERNRFAPLSAVAVPVLYVPVCGLALGTSATVAKVLVGLPPGRFLEVLEMRDVLYGAFLTIVLSCVPAGWSLLGARLTRSPGRGLVFKLVMTWFAMSAAYAVARTVTDFAETGR